MPKLKKVYLCSACGDDFPSGMVNVLLVRNGGRYLNIIHQKIT